MADRKEVAKAVEELQLIRGATTPETPALQARVDELEAVVRAGVPHVLYSSNNSGGRWWVSDDGWKALEAAGWRVEWFRDNPPSMGFFTTDGNERWMGALACCASLETASMGDAIASFEEATGLDSSDLGCACCGVPHSFYRREPDPKAWDGWSQGESYSPERRETSGRRYGE